SRYIINGQPHRTDARDERAGAGIWRTSFRPALRARAPAFVYLSSGHDARPAPANVRPAGNASLRLRDDGGMVGSVRGANLPACAEPATCGRGTVLRRADRGDDQASVRLAAA